jgi:hypothetical protein
MVAIDRRNAPQEALADMVNSPSNRPFEPAAIRAVHLFIN